MSQHFNYRCWKFSNISSPNSKFMLVQKTDNCPHFNDIKCKLLFTALSTIQSIKISISTPVRHYVKHSLERLCSLVKHSSVFSQTCGIYSSYPHLWHFHFRRLKRARTQRHAFNAILWTAKWENTAGGGRFVSLLPVGTLSGCAVSCGLAGRSERVVEHTVHCCVHAH